MRGSIQPNHIPVNRYLFQVIGLPLLTPTEISGIELELQTVDLPDRTKASGGETNPVEFTMMIPLHHLTEVAAVESWFAQSQGMVSPNYKKIATLVMQRIGPGPSVVKQLTGVFPTKLKYPDLEQANEGEMATLEITLSADSVL
jgi:hypothetical protein